MAGAGPVERKKQRGRPNLVEQFRCGECGQKGSLRVIEFTPLDTQLLYLNSLGSGYEEKAASCVRGDTELSGFLCGRCHQGVRDERGRLVTTYHDLLDHIKLAALAAGGE